MFARFFKGLLPDLSVYSPGRRPRRERKPSADQAKRGATRNPVHKGNEYEEHQEDGSLAWTARNASSRHTTQGELDKWDVLYLDERFGVDVKGFAKWDRTRAIKIKYLHCVEGKSAAAIDQEHRTKDGKVQTGFSERTVADYIWAINRAEQDRLEHQAETPPPRQPVDPNTVEW